jgi:cation diffusion facilitator CzcD-associated flavoprotein CzcO
MTVDVAIVGSGFAGLGAAVKLDEAGRRNWIILEKAAAVGGTWRENTYPGCACDVPSHLYSFSFAPNPNWTHLFARQPEIRRYLEGIADRYGLRDRIRFGEAVTGAEWDGAAWSVRTTSGDTVRAKVVIWATGPLHEPSIPEIEGLESFAGTVFHSAHWDHDHDLRGRRVAVIGTGASAIQFVPQIAAHVGHLTLFQRTAPWVLPKPDRTIPSWLRRAYAVAPVLQRLQRAVIYGRNEALVGNFLHPARMRIVEAVARRYLDRRFAGRPDLVQKLTPDFTLGCKRILLSNDYYPSLLRGNVQVETGAITRVTEHAVVTADGVEHEVDTIIFGTGFRVGDTVRQMTITGRDGVKLADAWSAGAESFLGTTVAGFPNMFALAGPNTGLGHSSMVYMIESQLAYVLDALRLVDEHGAVAIDTRRDRQDAFNADVQRRFEGTVWTSGGCLSWYLDPDGRNRVLWPGYTFSFRRRTRRVDPADHELVGCER